MDNSQDCDSYIIIPSSQTYTFYPIVIYSIFFLGKGENWNRKSYGINACFVTVRSFVSNINGKQMLTYICTLFQGKLLDPIGRK
jgi:hypothetical protein